MKKFVITYVEKNTYADGLEQSVKRLANSPEEASSKFQTENMGICDRIVSVSEC
jgi:hypothetical protein